MKPPSVLRCFTAIKVSKFYKFSTLLSEPRVGTQGPISEVAQEIEYSFIFSLITEDWIDPEKFELQNGKERFLSLWKIQGHFHYKSLKISSLRLVMTGDMYMVSVSIIRDNILILTKSVNDAIQQT